MSPPGLSADVIEGPERSPEVAATPHLTPADLAILAYAGALLVVWSPSLNFALLTPRMALVFTALGPGLVVVAGLARRADRAARWAGAYLLWALVAVVVSHHPRQSFVATYGTDVGWIYLAGYFAAWGLGRRLGPRARRVLPVVLLAGLGLNVCVAVLEAALNPTGDLATDGGRVNGLMSNPLFLGGLLAGGMAMTGAYAGTSPSRRRLAVLALVPLGLALNLTGSRAALVGGFAFAVLSAFLGGRRAAPAVDAAGAAAPNGRARAGLRIAALVGGAIVVGILMSLPLQRAEGGSTRLTDTSTSGGYTSRGIMWRIGLDAAAQRPIAGWGPGRFGEATSPHTTAEFVRAEGSDRLFYDAHNLIVEHLVTTGVVGLVLLSGFAWSTVRRARGPLAWFAAGIILTWMFNPVSVCTGPLALLALGAAARVESADAVVPGRWVLPARLVGAALFVLGALAGVRLVWADALLDRGVASGDVATMEHAARLLPADSVVINMLAQARSQVADARPTAANRAAVVRETRRSAELDPTRSHWLVIDGYAAMYYGPGTKAEDARAGARRFREALQLSPWSVEAMGGLRRVAIAQHDKAAERHWTDRLCSVGVCAPK